MQYIHPSLYAAGASIRPWAFLTSASSFAGTAPVTLSMTLPFWYALNVGIARMSCSFATSYPG